MLPNINSDQSVLIFDVAPKTTFETSNGIKTGMGDGLFKWDPQQVGANFIPGSFWLFQLSHGSCQAPGRGPQWDQSSKCHKLYLNLTWTSRQM